MTKAEERSLTTQAKAQSIRALFNDNRVKGEIMKALPRHLTADKLIRVAMTSIQRNAKLMDCSQQSLLGCIMTAAALGLEPDPFLGQAYFVPYWNSKKNCFEAQFMPGYRGYIALARRTGEVQSVSSHVVYERDSFLLQFGLTEKLEHIPVDGDRGNIKGAYVIFRYKDGSYSFDYMTYSDIKEIATRSKTYDAEKKEWTGPWSTDEGEMCKKTVIKRHAKLVPMSVDFNKASALEDRVHMGESQMDFLTEDAPGTMIEMDGAQEEEPPTFDSTIPEGTDLTALSAFLERNAAYHKKTVEEIKVEAAKNPAEFWKIFGAWVVQEQKRKEREADGKRGPGRPEGSKNKPKEQGKTVLCPDQLDESARAMPVPEELCGTCDHREGCPALG